MQLMVFITVLCFTTWMSFVQATPGRVANCCIQWSKTRIPLDRVKTYTIQSEGVCPISAVLIYTVKGNILCSDPNSRWARRVFQKVNRERNALLEKEQSEEGSTTDMTPALSTLPKTRPQQKDRRGRRRQGKQKRRGKKGQKKDA